MAALILDDVMVRAAVRCCRTAGACTHKFGLLRVTQCLLRSENDKSFGCPRKDAMGQQATCSKKRAKKSQGDHLFRQRRDLLVQPSEIALPADIIRCELHQTVHDRLSLSQRRQCFPSIL